MTVSPNRLLAVGGPLHGKRWHAHDGVATTLERDDDGELTIEHRYEVWAAPGTDRLVLVHADLSEDERVAQVIDALLVERDRLASHAHALFVRVNALAGAQGAVGSDLAALGLHIYASPEEVSFR